MKDFDNKPGHQEPGHLFTNGFPPLFIKPSKELPDRLKSRINIESVLSEFSRYTWHVRGLPCENVLILTDELDERTFLFRIQVGTDAELLGRIARYEVNKLSFCCRFELQGRIMLRSWLL